jgi:hypothetical protein
MEIQIADDESAANDVDGSNEKADDEYFGFQLMLDRKQNPCTNTESMDEQ